ncbi:MAG: transposase [Coraliomargarita sp.]
MFYNPWTKTEVSKRNLPHWHQNEALYFVTFRLADSIPQNKLKQWRAERHEWLHAHPEPWSDKVLEEYEERFPKKFQKWLDAGHGCCCLKEESSAQILRNALLYFNGERYKLDDWVIMPNHVHALLHLKANETLPKVLHSLKSFTAKEINKLRGKSGEFWQSESYDRIVRSEAELGHFRKYIRENPSKAGISLSSLAYSWK